MVPGGVISLQRRGLHTAFSLGEVVTQFFAQIGQLPGAPMEGGPMAQAIVDHAEILEHQIDRIELQLHGDKVKVNNGCEGEVRGSPTPPSPADW